MKLWVGRLRVNHISVGRIAVRKCGILKRITVSELSFSEEEQPEQSS